MLLVPDDSFIHVCAAVVPQAILSPFGETSKRLDPFEYRSNLEISCNEMACSVFGTIAQFWFIG